MREEERGGMMNKSEPVPGETWGLDFVEQLEQELL